MPPRRSRSPASRGPAPGASSRNATAPPWAVGDLVHSLEHERATIVQFPNGMYNIRSHVGRTSHVGVNQILGRISRTSAAPNLPLNPPLPRLKRAKVLLYFALIVSAIKVGSTRLVRHLAEIADADAVSFEAANTNRWRTSASVIDAVEFRAAACGVGGSGDSGSETALTAESCDDVFAYADTDADGALDEAEYGWATSLASGARSLGSHRLFVWLVLWPSRLLFLGLAATIMIGMVSELRPPRPRRRASHGTPRPPSTAVTIPSCVPSSGRCDMRTASDPSTAAANEARRPASAAAHTARRLPPPRCSLRLRHCPARGWRCGAHATWLV